MTSSMRLTRLSSEIYSSDKLMCYLLKDGCILLFYAFGDLQGINGPVINHTGFTGKLVLPPAQSKQHWVFIGTVCAR